jgi:anti-sigma factor RsiW
MSHADEGTLHAYLDGELTPVERAGVEAHLAGCAACRTRLDEERELAERALELLARVAPPEGAVPPIQRTGGRGARPLPRWMPLAWAASVLLALGTGWLARGGRVGGSGSDADLALAQIERQRPDRSATEADAPVPAGRGERDAPIPAAPPAPGRRGTEAKTTAAQEGGAGAGVAPAATAMTADRANRLAATPAPAVQAQDRPSRAETATDEAAATGHTRAALPSTITMDSARSILGADLATIPGLPVRRVALERPGVVMVEQALDEVTVVRLYQQRDAGAVARPAELSERLARYVGSLRVEITGTVGADSLSKLLGRVR